VASATKNAKCANQFQLLKHIASLALFAAKDNLPIEYKFAAKAAATILQPTLKLMQNSGGQDEAQRNRDFDPHYHG